MDLAQEHLESMPESSGTSIGSDQSTNAETLDNFDPAKHATDSKGNPIFNKDGSYRAKRKRKSTTKSSIDTSKTQSSQQACRMAAMATVDGISAMTSLFFSTEWGYIQSTDDNGNVIYDERQNGIEAFTRYYEAKGITDIPPGVGVTIWAIGYVGARFAKAPRTKNQIKLGWEWVKSKFSKKGKSDGSHIDTGHDRVGQNNAG